MTDIAEVLAGHATAQTFDNLAGTTVSATTDALFDSLAVALAGVDAPGVPAARQAFAPWAGGTVPVWGTSLTMPAPFAALLNAGSLHALDYDDTDDGVPLHANSVVLPVLLADVLENAPDCGGREFLTALSAGIDAAMRVGRAGGPRGSRGWNYSVVSGGMGAVLALARLRRWDVATTVSALGHQLAQTAGSLQSIIDGSLAKRFQPAMVAKDVLTGAALAEAGIDGPRNVFEGKAGFFTLYQDGSYDRDVLLDGAARASLVDDLSLKPYPSCRFTHAAIDVALRIHRDGIDPRRIARIRFLVSGQAMNMVGRAFDPATAGVVDAQFSIAYTAAVGLHRGAVLIDDFSPASIRDPEVGGFAARRVVIEPTEAVPHLAMAPVTAQLDLDDGRQVEYLGKTVSGSPEARLTAEQLKSKAADCLRHGRSQVGVDELWAAVHGLAEDEPVSRILRLLHRPVR
ncbi:MmgE/PrpD family protein [Amycolatopsis acidicola]|uniref:MmgE/PrpD family protein n=1 Tax=Amycolatopsis acidicola TaxID=2596893 RepID=A0A5N0VER2_9PSEU|nr:MmgE/PrpD family protein [Amycolatopsis acidicola]KAA9163321.1 MmgE/PrpD family protein [Amycolatopsis acidicola]